MVSLQQESYFLPVNEKDTVHLKRIWSGEKGEPVFLLHGSVENGRIFYSRSLKGFGPYLARQGYDVFIPDLRGRGESRPLTNRHSDYGNFEMVIKDIPLILARIEELNGSPARLWGAHSWGGVLLQCFLARNPAVEVDRMAFFGVTRRKRVRNLQRFVYLDLGWRLLMRAMVALYGYAPTSKMGIGSDDETRSTYFETRRWMFHDPWVQAQDGLDYRQAFSRKLLPPTLYLAGGGDSYLAHPSDIRRHPEEAPGKEDHFVLLSKEQGHLHDYDHNNMLTHADSEKDHFPQVLQWLREGKF